MKRFVLLPAVLTLPLAGCVVGFADGAPYSESMRHTYTNFDRVDVSAGVETVVKQGAFDVQAEALKGESFDNLIVEVSGKTLRISRKPQMFDMDSTRYRVTVSAPVFEAFEASSGSSLDGAGLSLSNISVDVSSGASVDLSGTCTAIDVDVSSGASFDGEGLQCDIAKVDASSGATVRAFARQSADGNASSGANVTFHGNPSQFREDSSSGGSVRSR
jgi:hypothetical protein